MWCPVILLRYGMASRMTMNLSLNSTGVGKNDEFWRNFAARKPKQASFALRSFSALPLLMYPNVHSAAVLENPPFFLTPSEFREWFIERTIQSGMRYTLK